MQGIRLRNRRGNPYDHRMDERAQRIRDLIEEITEIEDPRVRAKAATEALDVVHTGNSTLAKARREGIVALREAGLSYRKIADAIGIHFTRVKQIETGAPTGVNARRKQQAEE